MSDARPTPLTFAELCERHLDLRPLRGRARGLVRCIFHADSSASLSLDLDKEVFHCFGCGVGGGAWQFAELVGQPMTSPVALGRPLSSREEARLDVLRRERRARARRALYAPAYHLASTICRGHQFVKRVRAEAKNDTPETWDQLARAADLEVMTWQLEADADEELLAAVHADRVGSRRRR